MFRSNGQSVEENQEDDQPIENLGFDSCTALPPEQPVPSSGVTAEKENKFLFTYWVLSKKKRFGRMSGRAWDGAK